MLYFDKSASRNFVHQIPRFITLVSKKDIKTISRIKLATQTKHLSVTAQIEIGSICKNFGSFSINTYIRKKSTILNRRSTVRESSIVLLASLLQIKPHISDAHTIHNGIPSKIRKKT